MKVVVLSCAKYSDAWVPFFTLFRKFWPDCPYPIWLVTDNTDGFFSPLEASPSHVFRYDSPSWNKILAEFCRKHSNEPIMLFLEDYFLLSTPHQDLIDYALNEYWRHEAQCVRLYPCPGGVADYGDPYFAGVPYGEPYRISTQVAIWHPKALQVIAENTNSPKSFETDGSKCYGGGPIFAFQRNVSPWPLEYICTAIVTGVWQRGAIDWCRQNGIELDLTQRPVQDA